MNHPGAENVYRYMETGYNSDAYGRYQMLSSTWASWARQADIPTTKLEAIAMEKHTTIWLHNIKTKPCLNILFAQGYKMTSLQAEWSKRYER